MSYLFEYMIFIENVIAMDEYSKTIEDSSHRIHKCTRQDTQNNGPIFVKRETNTSLDVQ